MRKLLAALVLLIVLVFPAVTQAQEVATSAKACVVMDMDSGRILLSHHADAPLPMASTTKIMTALIALENGDLTDTVICGRNAFGVPGTSIYLEMGESLSMADMLRGLLLASGNDAAVAIAEHVGGSVEDFCRMMTDRAASLGCTDTVFLTPHGLPCEGHHTTAADLARITRAAMAHDFFRETVSTQRATIPWQGRGYDRVLNNKNRLLSDYEGAMGVKTGYTRAAGRCLVTAAQRNGMRVICVVLNCADWFNESTRLLDMAFDQWESQTLLYAGETLRYIPVTDACEDSVPAVLASALTGLVPRGTLPHVELELPDALAAPVTAGMPIGEVRMLAGGEIIAAASLVAGTDAARDDLPARMRRLWTQWLVAP